MSLKIQKNKILVYIALVLVNIYYGINNTTQTLLNGNLIMLAALGILCVHIVLYEHLSPRMLLVFCVLLTVFGVNYFQTQDSRVLILLVTVMAIRNVDLQMVLRIFFYTRLTVFLTVILLSFLRIIPSFVIYSVRGPRYALGYTHPNQIMAVVCMLCLMYICLKFDKLKWTHYITLIASVVLGYSISKSNTGLITSGVIMVLFILYRCCRMEKMLEVLGKHLPWILMFLSLFLPYTLKANVDFLFLSRKCPQFVSGYVNLLRHLDTAMSSRLTLSRLTLLKTDFGLFGSKTGSLQATYTLVDSGYVQLLLVFGIMGGALFFVLCWYMVRELIKRKQYVYIWAFIGISIYAFTENVFCSLAYNFVLLFMAELFQSKRASISKEVVNEWL